ncbi:uncharacterized protein LOC112690119 [Sipha flava]|uniref:Uncharacterized protein LOC112690119 n=1 Tax=Sipha flava TaxID=143950 RepID=A0A8B8GAN6_9HEMI|nr:uncharacterized protein LOC112690119 [Sipha flava]XP_025419830.1 uncharacterized protein LOC112690119 [Sipha flava]
MEKQNNSLSNNVEVIWSRNSSTSGSKSLPLIKGININESAIKVKKLAKSYNFSRDIGNNEHSVEHAHKHVKRSLFQEKKKINKNVKINYKSSEKLKLSCPKSPIFPLNRKKLMINQDLNSKKCLFQINDVKTEKLLTSQSACDKSNGISPHIENKIDSLKKNLLCPNSSDLILSNQKRFTNLDSKNDFIDKKCNMKNKCILQADMFVDTKVIEKSEELNVHLNLKNTNMHNVDSEDIIESSEVINLPCKEKKKKEKHCYIKNTKIKNCKNGSETSEIKCFNKQNDLKLQSHGVKRIPQKVKTNKNEFKNTINFDSLDFLKAENLLKSPIFDFGRKNTRSESKHIEPQKNLDITDNVKFHLGNRLVPASVNSKKFVEKIFEKQFRTDESSYKESDLNVDQDKCKIFTHSSEIRVIPATPEHYAVHVGRPAIEYSPEIVLNSKVPLIEVDQSPKTPQRKINHVLIQSVQTPSRKECVVQLPGLFEPVTSPTQPFIDLEQQFKIDTMESPSADSEYENVFETEVCMNKSNNSPSPNRFDSAKKRRKIGKDGLRGKFRDLINRKKSEACIREYEKNLSKSYQPKECETALLNIIEAWKEFRSFVLLCYYINSEKKVQKVLVTLENCPKNVTKNSIIRIYSPWSTIKSEKIEVLLFIGVIHAEVIEFSESTMLLEPKALFTNFKGLLTNVFRNEVVWECNCSEENACQCLGELSTFNYLKYMIS